MATAAQDPLADATPEKLHPALVAAAEAGHYTILDLFDDHPWFHGPNTADWTAWRAFLAALYGLPMNEAELDRYRRFTGRQEAPTEPSREAWVPVGRRGRKSAIAAVVGLWQAAFRIDAGRYLAKGEVAVVPILSVTKDKALKIHQYMTAMLDDPTLSYLRVKGKPEPGEKRRPGAIHLFVPTLSGGYRVDVIIEAANLKAGRSDTNLGAILDEIAFFRSEESANPDKDIVAGITPGMVAVPGGLVLGISSPYARRGILYERFEEHYGKPGKILVWRAATVDMHDTPQIRAEVAEEFRKDPESAKAEYGAEFRTDVEAYIPIEVVRAVTVEGRFELPFVDGRKYYGFVDPAGGGGSGDPYAWSIGHWDGKKAIQDLLRSKEGKFDPAGITAECTRDMMRYGIKRVIGDHWAGEWAPAFFAHGIHDDLCPRASKPYVQCTRKDGCWTMTYESSAAPKSDLYKDFLPFMTTGGVELLDSKDLRTEFVGLDRRTARGGRDSIDHLPGAHDDLANATAGVLLEVLRAHRKPEEFKAETQEELHRREVMDSLKERLRRIERRQRRGGGGSSGDFPSNG